MSEWSEGICGGDVVILRNGEIVTISDVLIELNKVERLQAENAKLLDIATRWVDTRVCSADTLDALGVARAGKGEG